MTQHRTILVVDDERMIRQSVSSFLQQKGYVVLTAETGREALQILGERPVSLLVLDLMLPDVSGEVICQQIRQHEGAGGTH